MAPEVDRSNHRASSRVMEWVVLKWLNPDAACGQFSIQNQHSALSADMVLQRVRGFMTPRLMFCQCCQTHHRYCAR
jgi:hypothetical protein